MQYNKLINNLDLLKLNKIKEYLPHYLDHLAQEERSIVDILCELTEKEIEGRKERSSEMNIKMANFPFIRTINEFDYDYQPSLSKSQIYDLGSLRFIEDNENILFIGTSGVGKTHLATAIGIEAANKRVKTYFISCGELMNRLHKAYLENRHEAVLKQYAKYRLLIIDEIGYLPIDKQGANLFFQLIAMRYEKKPTIITSNIGLSKWGEIFPDKVIANAIVDRLVHHSKIIRITGKSYRIKNKLTDEDSKESINKNQQI